MMTRLDRLKQLAWEATDRYRHYARIDGLLTRDERAEKAIAEQRMNAADRAVMAEKARLASGGRR